MYRNPICIFFFLFLITDFCNAQTVSLNTENPSLYQVLEFTLSAKQIKFVNPFTEGSFIVEIISPDGNHINIEGFCDDQSGKIFRARYMPAIIGEHTYKAIFNSGKKKTIMQGRFVSVKGDAKGPVKVDPEHPWHMIYAGTGEHFFWNSATCYWILGWKDEGVNREIIDRYARYGINRIRVGINARQDDGSRWSEPLVKESPGFTFKLNPWVAKRPDDLDNPGFDITRFNVEHWQKLDRLIDYARKKGIVVSLIFYVDGLEHGCDPFKKERMGGPEEQRYYAYAAARYSAFENIMWDITNEYHLFRTVDWVNIMGPFLKQKDHNNHIISVHGSADFPFRNSSFIDVVLYQSWDECGGYNFITSCRQKQKESGRIIPQINEEYGYEDHYPPWGCGATAAKIPDGRNALNRVRLAWEICMAGGYQTTGERANEGTGAGKDAGGGWINGRGNEQMVMLSYYKILKQVFEKIRFWEMEPMNDLVPYGNLCLANPGKQYLVYNQTQAARVSLSKGEKYQVWMIDPFTGKTSRLPDAETNDGSWQYPGFLKDPFVFLLERIQ
jgi:Protein of unknown function (DUF4038)/Domain of unknown function (DUF5060)